MSTEHKIVCRCDGKHCSFQEIREPGDLPNIHDIKLDINKTHFLTLELCPGCELEFKEYIQKWERKVSDLKDRPKATHFTTIEGGDWIAWPSGVRPEIEKGRALGLVFSLKFEDGSVWDFIVGWRNR